MLLPNEWIENSIETYIYQHTTKSQVIYWVVLAIYLCGYLRTGKRRGETGGGEGGNHFLHYRNRGFGIREGR